MKNVQRLQRSTCSGHVMLLLLQRCMSLSLWVTCYCLCGLVMSFIFLLTAAANTKIISKRRINWSHFKSLLISAFVLHLFIIWQWNRKEMWVFAIKQINVVCAISRTARGGRWNCGCSFSPCLAPLRIRNYWILLKGVLVMAFATDDTCSRPRHLHRLMFSQTEHFNQWYCNHTDVFYSNQAAQRRWLGEQGQCRVWRRGTQIMPP